MSIKSTLKPYKNNSYFIVTIVGILVYIRLI